MNTLVRGCSFGKTNAVQYPMSIGAQHVVLALRGNFEALYFDDSSAGHLFACSNDSTSGMW